MKLILPVVAMLLTAVMTLAAVTFCLAMGANSTPAQIRAIKFWSIGLSLLGTAGIVIGIILLRKDQFNGAAWVAFSPSVIIFIIFLIAMFKWRFPGVSSYRVITQKAAESSPTNP